MVVTLHRADERPGSPRWRIYRYVIERGPISAMDIARALGMHESQVYQTLRAGIQNGLKIKVKPGVPRLYSMTEEVTRHLPASPPRDLSIAGLLRWYGLLDELAAAGTPGS